MRAFHEAFTSHKPKDVAKWYMMAVFAKANDYWFTKQLEDGTPITTEKEAMQYAWDSLSQSLDTLNPDRVAVTATTKKGKRNQILKRIQALVMMSLEQLGGATTAVGAKTLESIAGSIFFDITLTSSSNKFRIKVSFFYRFK